MPHFAVTPHFAPHVSAARPSGGHFASPRSSHFSVSHLSGSHSHLVHSSSPNFTHFGRTTHTGGPHFGTRSVRTNTPGATTLHGNARSIQSPNVSAGRNVTALPAARQHGLTDPGNFAAHRQFTRNAAFRPFLNGEWHRHHHLGWVGPLFWPYAYGDFFYYALWPDDYAYVDPFWAYGYGDIYEGIFSPYSYDEYVAGRGAPARMTALTEQMAQSCSDEAAEVTGWPIDQIQDAVKPSAEQNTLLDDLGNAVVKASDEIKSHCPTSVSFTPTGRLETMQQRLQALVTAVNIVSPPLTKFYDSLNDEQKARFNEIGAKQGEQKERASNASAPKGECDASVMAWPGDQIDRVVRPNEAQRVKLEALQSAAANAADVIKAACPSEAPSTPPSRLAAIGKHLQAMLQAVETIRPKLDDFYNALSDDQKARFNTMGRRLFAEK